MNTIYRNGQVYSNTALQIPVALKIQAKAKGINFSRTLCDALREKIEESKE